MSINYFEEQKIRIEKLINAEEEGINQVMLALREAPLIIRAGSYAAEKAAKTQTISEEDALDVIIIISLLVILTQDEGFSKDEVINLVIEFVENDKILSKYSEDKITNLRNRLVGLLNNAFPLVVAYKASKVFDDYERIFEDAKVVTDMRPLFDSDTGEDRKIQAISISHTIKINYKDLEGEKEFFVGLETDDLMSLLSEIITAIEKNNSIKSMLKNAQIPYVDSELD